MTTMRDTWNLWKMLTVKKKEQGGRDIMKTKQKQGKVAELTYSDIPNSTLYIIGKCLKSPRIYTLNVHWLQSKYLNVNSVTFLQQHSVQIFRNLPVKFKNSANISGFFPKLHLDFHNHFAEVLFFPSNTFQRTKLGVLRSTLKALRNPRLHWHSHTGLSVRMTWTCQLSSLSTLVPPLRRSFGVLTWVLYREDSARSSTLDVYQMYCNRDTAFQTTNWLLEQLQITPLVKAFHPRVQTKTSLR